MTASAPSALARDDVMVADASACGVHANEHVVVAWDWPLDLFYCQYVGRAVAATHDGTHRCRDRIGGDRSESRGKGRVHVVDRVHGYLLDDRKVTDSC